METIRTIHHLAASGGTIMSKALAAQPSVVLLSEIAPLVGPLKYNPFDPVQQFIRNYLVEDKSFLPEVDRGKYARSVLSERIRKVWDVTRNHGRVLIIRDHAHSDYMRPQPRRESSLLRALEEASMPTLSVFTIRDPIDSWLSSSANGWTRGTPSFDDYCGRLLLFISSCPRSNLFLYEDFVVAPERVTRAMCECLNIGFEEGYQERLGSIRLTGESGRTGSEIRPRPRRPVHEEFLEEVGLSDNYRKISAMFGYGI